jgi:hypothetical protein
MAKLLALLCAVALCEFSANLATQTVDPQIRTDLAVDAVNGGNTALRSYEHTRAYVRPALLVFYVALGAFLFWPTKPKA